MSIIITDKHMHCTCLRYKELALACHMTIILCHIPLSSYYAVIANRKVFLFIMLNQMCIKITPSKLIFYHIPSYFYDYDY